MSEANLRADTKQAATISDRKRHRGRDEVHQAVPAQLSGYIRRSRREAIHRVRGEYSRADEAKAIEADKNRAPGAGPARVQRLPHDPKIAEMHFAGLIVMMPLDKIMFGGTFTAEELTRFADAGVRVFLAAYGAAGSTGT